MIYLGFDTSNYTTSVACCGDVSMNERQLLEVKKGDRGLRQSDALFQHIKKLPDLFEKLSENIDMKKVIGIGVSTTPRRVDGSYMPVFLAGHGYAKVCADALGVPLYTFSHQEGHIMAGIHSCGDFSLLEKPFISVHLSGGTCEILLSEYKKGHFECEIIGGTKDISAGQLIDRVGVFLGLDFPCGKELEKISQKADKTIKLPVNSNDGYINFSGIETKTLSMIGKEEDAVLAYSLFDAISKALSDALDCLVKKYKTENILVVGGVASNSIIKNNLLKNVCAKVDFASVEYSTDNAYGTALLCERICKK